MPKKGGPPPLPADVIELRGNRSKLSEEELAARREAEEKTRARPLTLEPPGDLDPLERECWKMHAPELAHLGLLSVLDAGAFRFACTSYALAISALREMRPRKADGTFDRRKKGFAVVEFDKGHGTLKKHPAFTVYAQAVNDYRRWAVEFGLTPSARIGLRPGASAPPVVGDHGDEDDDAFFGT